MAKLQPFQAFRPQPERAERVASPPYDVVNTAQARALAAGNSDSFLRVSRPEVDLPEGIDEHSEAVYQKGRENLLAFVEQKLLVQDAEPAFYIYAQTMGEHRQVGVVACAPVADYLEGRIKKHEKTRPDKEDDRTQHIGVLEAHDEPVFLTYQASTVVDALVAEVMAAPARYDFRSKDDVRHELWTMSSGMVRRLEAAFSEDVGDLYVADGHHRSAAAARVHQERRGDGRAHDGFLVVVFPHNQMNIMAYNRVVVDPKKRSGAELLAALGEAMDIAPADAAQPEKPATFGIYVDGRWYRAVPRSYDSEDPVAGLDCQICQDQILQPIFGIEDPRRDANIDFVGGIHGAAELERRVDCGEASLAIYLYPTSMEQVMRVSDAGKVMPPKSTWFEPKLRSGLFVHTF